MGSSDGGCRLHRVMSAGARYLYLAERLEERGEANLARHVPELYGKALQLLPRDSPLAAQAYTRLGASAASSRDGGVGAFTKALRLLPLEVPEPEVWLLKTPDVWPEPDVWPDPK